MPLVPLVPSLRLGTSIGDSGSNAIQSQSLWMAFPAGRWERETLGVS